MSTFHEIRDYDMKGFGKNYKYLIFDADHTLLDYVADETGAFLELYAEIGMPITESLMKDSRRLSESKWTEAGLYNVYDEEIQREYHSIYRRHVAGIFEEIFRLHRFSGDAEKTGKSFLEKLSKQGKLFVGAEEVLQALSKKMGGRYEIAIATNGLSFIQEGRLRNLKKYASHLFVSEGLGAIKPVPAYFEKLLEGLGANADECLMIGDSLHSDVAGANGAGMDSCWYNPKGVENDGYAQPTYEIHALRELLTLLG